MSTVSLYRSIETQICPTLTLYGFLIEIESGGKGGRIKAASAASFHDGGDLSVSKWGC